MGRKKLNKTADELRKQGNIRSKRYYWKHKEQCNRKRMERYWLEKDKRHIVSEKMRKQISNAQIGKKCPQKGNGKKGKAFTEEHKRKLSEAHKGQPLSEATKQKLHDIMTSPNNPCKGRPLSEEHRQKLREAKKRRRESILASRLCEKLTGI